MSKEHTYRDLLVSTLAFTEYGYDSLLELGMTLIVYDDAKAGIVPFEDGDLIPVYPELFTTSEIPAAQVIGKIIPKLRETFLTLTNLNNITSEELYGPDEEEDITGEGNEEEDEDGAEENFREMSPHGLVNEIYGLLSEILYVINSSTYRLLYDRDGDELEEDLRLPDSETYALLETDDANFKQLIELSKFINEHRDAVWD